MILLSQDYIRKLEKLKKSGEWEKLSVPDAARLLKKVNIDASQASNQISKCGCGGHSSPDGVA